MQERQEKRDRLEKERDFLKAEEERIARTVSTMPITSTPGFEGYRIVEYGGYVSGDEAIHLDKNLFIYGLKKDQINDSIKAMRSVAIEELKTAAAQIGCNAVVGLDFDYVTLDRTAGLNGTSTDSYVILTANGTAVTIEPL